MNTWDCGLNDQPSRNLIRGVKQMRLLRLGFVGAVAGLVLVAKGFVHTSAEGAEPSCSGTAAASLSMCGITVDKLLAAGVTTDQFATVVSAAADYVQNNGSRWDDADTALSDARDQLRRAMDTGTPEQVEAARVLMAQWQLQRTTLHDELFSLVCDQFTPAESTRLQRVKANSSWRVPLKYLVQSRTESSWIQLRDSLAAVAEAQRAGCDPDSASLETVSAADADSDTVAADQALRHLDEAREAWREAF